MICRLCFQRMSIRGALKESRLLKERVTCFRQGCVEWTEYICLSKGQCSNVGINEAVPALEPVATVMTEQTLGRLEHICSPAWRPESGVQVSQGCPPSGAPGRVLPASASSVAARLQAAAPSPQTAPSPHVCFSDGPVQGPSTPRVPCPLGPSVPLGLGSLPQWSRPPSRGRSLGGRALGGLFSCPGGWGVGSVRVQEGRLVSELRSRAQAVGSE